MYRGIVPLVSERATSYTCTFRSLFKETFNLNNLQCTLFGSNAVTILNLLARGRVYDPMFAPMSIAARPVDLLIRWWNSTPLAKSSGLWVARPFEDSGIL